MGAEYGLSDITNVRDVEVQEEKGIELCENKITSAANSASEASPDNGSAVLMGQSLEALSPNNATDVENGEDAEEPQCFSRAVGTVQERVALWCKQHNRMLWRAFYIVVLLGWIGYSAYAMYYNFHGGFDASKESPVRLMSINIVALICVCYWAVKRHAGKPIYDLCLNPLFTAVEQFHDKYWFVLKWLYGAALLGAVAAIIIVKVALNEPRNLISGIGLLIYIGLSFIFSSNPAKVRWRPVISGLLLQFVFALLILRTCWGFMLFKWLGDRIQEFLQHGDEGSKFVFGDLYEEHFFAFKVLPVIVFFSAVISMMYYLGWMQVIIKKTAWVMQVTKRTTAGESLNAAASVFVGMSEAALIVKPLLRDMTRSELHAVMTGGFAAIAGSVMATYILFGVPAIHLLSASIMSAPAALAVSKLFCPETKKSKTSFKDLDRVEISPEHSLIEAASAGASGSVSLVANIAANLIAFLAVKKFLNETLKWLGAQVGLAPPKYPQFTFEFICSYVLWPFAWVMGADSNDCGEVASLIGVKTFTNEFIAYTELANLIKNRKEIEKYDLAAVGLPTAVSNTFASVGTTAALVANATSSASVVNGTRVLDALNNCWMLADGRCLKMISERSEVISAYALCGFANLGSIGIVIGGLSSLVPERRKDIVAVVVRAMIAGNVACFMTACIAGLLSAEKSSSC